jgi:TusA-related sulfurtransferase
LKIIADDPAFQEDIKRWTKNTGNELLEVHKEGYEIVALIKKK